MTIFPHILSTVKKSLATIAVCALVANSTVGLPTDVYAQGVASIVFGQGAVTKNVGSEFTISIFVDPNTEAVDTARIVLSYPPEYLAVTNFALGSLLPDKSPGSSFNNETGKLSWGGFTTEGPIKAKGLFGTATFKALKEGDAVITMSPSSHLIGNGEEKINYSTLGQVSVKIVAPAPPKLEAQPPVTPPATPPATPAPVEVKPLPETNVNIPVDISSAVTPDQNNWYATPEVKVSWSRTAGVTSYMVGISSDPEAAPDTLVRGNTHTFASVADGVWYVTVAPRLIDGSLGATASYRIQVDTTKPRQFVPILEALRIEGGDQVLLKALFGAIDDTSGIAYFQVKVNDGEFEIAESPFAIRVGASDKIRFVVRAYDKAGNYQENTSEMTIDLAQLAVIAPEDIEGERLAGLPDVSASWRRVWADYRWSISLLGGLIVIGLGWFLVSLTQKMSLARQATDLAERKKKRRWFWRDHSKSKR